MADARRAVSDCLTYAPEPLADNSLVLVALSGGSDSLAVAWAAQFAVPKAGHRVEAVIVDHGLQDNSAEVAETAKATAAQVGLTAEIIAVDLEDSGNFEARAREARYAALESYAETRGASAVLLGHTLDDQAETVLMGLTRGSGPASIQGMATYTGIWWRPFLSLRRETTTQVCLDAGITWWDDPHNVDERFVRPRIRHTVMPVLEQHLGPGVAEALVRTGELLGRDREELDRQAWKLAYSIGDGVELGMIPVGMLNGVPVAIASRVVRIIVEESIGVSLSFHHTEQVLAFVTGAIRGTVVEIPEGRVEKHDDHYRVVPTSGVYRGEE